MKIGERKMRLKQLSVGDKFIFQPGEGAEELNVHTVIEVSETPGSKPKALDLPTGKETNRKFNSDDTVIRLNF